MSFANEKPVKAVRKRHRCDTCLKHIEIGEPAIRWTGMTDGDFGNAIMHPDCRKAEVKFNRLCDGGWDGWYSLKNDRSAEDDDWLLAEYPAVAARLGIAPTQSRSTLKDRGEGR